MKIVRIVLEEDAYNKWLKSKENSTFDKVFNAAPAPAEAGSEDASADDSAQTGDEMPAGGEDKKDTTMVEPKTALVGRKSLLINRTIG